MNENNVDFKVGDTVKIKNHPEKHIGVIKSFIDNDSSRVIVKGKNNETWNINTSDLEKYKKDIFSINKNNPVTGGNLMNMLQEEKAKNFKVGQTFTMVDKLGAFEKGDEVTVEKIKQYGNDVELHLRSDKKTDVFYLDPSDEL